MVWDGGTAEHWAAEWQVPRVVLFGSTTSTNDRARELADQAAPHLTVVLADHQSAGRGQHGRAWVTAEGTAILLSMIFRIDQLAAPQLLPLRIGMAVARAIEARTGITVQLKWPNDVLIDGRKTGGILCEGSSSQAGNVIIAGIGLNVFEQPADWPEELHASATSIARQLRATGAKANVGAEEGLGSPQVRADESVDRRHTLRRSELVSAIIDEVRIAPLHRPALAPDELESWAQRDFLCNRHVRIDGVLRGVALGISRDGALRIQSDSGVELVRSGTVRTDDGIS